MTGRVKAQKGVKGFLTALQGFPARFRSVQVYCSFLYIYSYLFSGYLRPSSVTENTYMLQKTCKADNLRVFCPALSKSIMDHTC